MVFSSVFFVIIFLPVLFLFYFLANDKAKNYVLLAFSLIFYGWGGPKYLILMIAMVLTDYLFALGIDFVRPSFQKKILVFLAVFSNLGILGYFKYTNFLVENINGLLGTKWEVKEIILPIGISFFTFQAMSYVIDVYRGDTKVQKNPFYVLLYVSLFPQLVAGPIVRYKTVENEIVNRKTSVDDFAYGLERFILGFAKKIIVSNNVGALADAVFATKTLDTPLAWLGAVAYTLQIYFDFSAYSDMAIGLGRIFGFHFEENFNFPYISQSVTEFWRRWHISLSTWFRDYIYIPLGGNRKGKSRQIFNMFVVWTLTGIWHGAEWNFVLWGFYYFILLMLEKLFLLKVLEKLPRVLRHIYAILTFMIGWVIFRCDSGGIRPCFHYIKTMLSFRFTALGKEQLMVYLHRYGLYLVIGVIFSMPVYYFVKKKCSEFKKNSVLEIGMGVLGYGVLLGLFGISFLYLVNSTYNPFIYFRF